MCSKNQHTLENGEEDKEFDEATLTQAASQKWLVLMVIFVPHIQQQATIPSRISSSQI